MFTDATHFYAASSNTFSRYSISASGVSLIDSTVVNGFGGSTDKFTVDYGLIYANGGDILNPSTTPPAQIGLLRSGLAFMHQAAWVWSLTERSLPGATVLWNGAARTTNYVSATQLTVDIPASDVASATTATLSCQNPGSTASNTLSVTVQ